MAGWVRLGRNPPVSLNPFLMFFLTHGLFFITALAMLVPTTLLVDYGGLGEIDKDSGNEKFFFF
jgi:hypothetical protein